MAIDIASKNRVYQAGQSLFWNPRSPARDRARKEIYSVVTDGTWRASKEGWLLAWHDSSFWYSEDKQYSKLGRSLQTHFELSYITTCWPLHPDFWQFSSWRCLSQLSIQYQHLVKTFAWANWFTLWQHRCMLVSFPLKLFQVICMVNYTTLPCQFAQL